MIDLENLGTGGAGGLITSLLAFFGIKSKVERIDKDLQDHKKTVVYTDTFQATIEPL